MGISQIAHALVLAGTILLSVSVLSADTASTPPPLRVAFLGRESATTDPNFRRFADAVNRMHAALKRPVQIGFVRASDPNGRIHEDAVAKAVRGRPDLLVAPNGTMAQVARRLAASVPMIFSSYLDPVQSRIASSMLARDEAVTGIWISDHLDGKRIEILLDAYPAVRRIAVIGDSWWAEGVKARETLPRRARELGAYADVFVAQTPDELQLIFNRADAPSYDAWCIPGTFLAEQNGAAIHERLRKWRKPAVFATTADVLLHGAPLGYELDTSFVWPGLASLAIRVLGGEVAGSIPIQRPQRFKLAVHARPIAELAPPDVSVLRRADVVAR